MVSEGALRKIVEKKTYDRQRNSLCPSRRRMDLTRQGPRDGSPAHRVEEHEEVDAVSG